MTQINEYNTLINLFKSGDHSAFESLVHLYRDSGEQFAKKYLNQYDVAEDIVQDAFVTVYINRTQFNTKYQFKTFLYTIIKNKCLDHLRKEAKLVYGQELEQTDDATPEAIYLIEEKKNMILEQLNKLSEPYQMAIHLVDYEDMSYADAAKVMHKTLASFKVTLMRARKSLKTQMERMVY